MNYVFKISLCLLVTIIPTEIVFASYVFVGNGGEGYKHNGKTYLRDLFEYERHIDPWVGTNPDPLLMTVVNSWNPLQLSPEETYILASKLTDLNRLKPNLGDDIMLALKSFEWSFTDEKILLLEKDEVRKAIHVENRIPIANRYFLSIIVNKQNFDLLDSRNKTALLIHEAVFALGNIRTFPNTIQPSIAVIRQIVAGMYSADAPVSDSLRKLIKTQLSLSYEENDQVHLSPFNAEEFEIFLTVLFPRKLSLRYILKFSVSQNLEERAKKICDESLQGGSTLTSLAMGPIRQRTIEPIPYSNDREVKQWGLYVTAPVYVKKYPYSSSTKECVTAIIDGVTEFLEARNPKLRIALPAR